MSSRDGLIFTCGGWCAHIGKVEDGKIVSIGMCHHV